MARTVAVHIISAAVVCLMVDVQDDGRELWWHEEPLVSFLPQLEAIVAECPGYVRPYGNDELMVKFEFTSLAHVQAAYRAVAMRITSLIENA